MTKDNLEELLQVTFEIEGLITLMLKREDRTPDKVNEMLQRKANKFNELLGNKCSEVECKEPEVAVKEVIVEANPIPEVEAVPVAPLVEEVPQVIREAEIAASAQYEETEDAIHQPVLVEETPIVTEVATAGVLNDQLSKKKPTFTLNDKFRFRRALFNNSDEEFEGTLRIISEMKTMEEVEDYLYNDLCFEPDNEDVKAFVEVITPHFI